ncbi:MAG: GTP 3',8-cyclase MoaA [Planctomycetota bacterium]
MGAQPTNLNAETHRREPLVDAFGRRHTSLRLSVTDRCNIRCVYCMPAGPVRFLPRDQVLTFEEIEGVARVLAEMGVDQIRLTGGEPLVRAELPKLVARLVTLPGVSDVALTTNAVLLAEHAEALRVAGLHRINVSLDTLSEEVFREVTRRDGLQKVLDGIAAAQRVGFDKIRLNAIALRGVTESEAPELARFAAERGMEMRFIEYMPLDADGGWQRDQVLSGAELREIIERHHGPLRPTPRPDPSQPAVDYEFMDGELAKRGGRIGFINPVTEPFCGDCNRLRLTAEGQVRNCLFSTEEWDARALLRSGGGDDDLEELIRQSVAAKKPGHGIDEPEFLRPQRAMYQIGG